MRAERSEGIARRAEQAVQRCTAERRKPFGGGHSDVGGLYGDNHLVADLALAWIAAGAKREGLRLKRTARLSQKLDASAVVLHDAHDEASNLWGAFDRARRNLPRIRLHFACKGL